MHDLNTLHKSSYEDVWAHTGPGHSYGRSIRVVPPPAIGGPIRTSCETMRTVASDQPYPVEQRRPTVSSGYVINYTAAASTQATLHNPQDWPHRRTGMSE